MNFRILSGADAIAIRKKLHLNQTEFWGPLNVSQSCGSRYEADAILKEEQRKAAEADARLAAERAELERKRVPATANWPCDDMGTHVEVQS